MSFIIAYQKFVNSEITRELRLPVDDQNQSIGTELATIEGVTYVSIPDEYTLPIDQPDEIKSTIKTIAQDDTVIAEIKHVSPHVKLINERVQEKISEKYTIQDEIKLIRTSPSQQFDEYNAYVESCRAWGRAEKVKLGL